MNLKKLTTLLFAGVTAATPFATNAQNPTILQGNYISNVFGQANFVLNPNAQTNVANVTLTNATATRSTTTPLVATSEWNVTVTSANGTAAWATRSFDAGMKNQNCEARFSYRGFQATSKAQIKQGANVVAELTLTPSATDPRIASINFPCGDLSSATTFVITDSATLSGTNEIGGIYVGLATNQANVAQAEVVVLASANLSQSIPNGVNTTVQYNIEDYDMDGAYNPSTGEFTVKKAGIYTVEARILWNIDTWAAGTFRNLFVQKNTGTYGSDRVVIEAAISQYLESSVFASFEANVGDVIRVKAFNSTSTAKTLFNSNTYNRLTIKRFPSSSELVVTPETQNVWGGVTYRGPADVISLFSGAAASSTYTTYNDATWSSYRDFKNSRCEAPISANNVGCQIKNLPVGSYKVTFSGLMYERMTAPTDVTCSYKIQETVTSSDVAYSTNKSFYTDGGVVWNGRTLVGTFRNTSVGDRNFVIQAAKTTDSSGTTGRCELYVGTTGGDRSDFNIVIEPLDNNSNSALYVQGPVKASATGTAIPSGYVGEVKEQICTSLAITTANTETDIPNCSINLTAGVWDVTYYFSTLVQMTGAGGTTHARVRLVEVGVGGIANTEGFTTVADGDTSTTRATRSMLSNRTIIKTNGTTIKGTLVCGTFGTAGNSCGVTTGNVSGSISDPDAVSKIVAVRLN